MVTNIIYAGGVIRLFNKRDQCLASKPVPNLTTEEVQALRALLIGKSIEELDLTGWTVH